MKRFLSVLIASMFLASAAFAAEEKTKGDEKKVEAKDKAKGDTKKTGAAKKTEAKEKGKGKADEKPAAK